MTPNSPLGSFEQAEQQVGKQFNIAGDVKGNINLIRIDSTDKRNLRNHEILRHKVRRYWINGYLNNSLYKEIRIQLGIDEHPNTVNNRLWDLALRNRDRSEQLIDAQKNLADVFEDCGQQLLILGQPGAGKTSLLLELTETLLNRTDNDSTLPTPVVLNLSSWQKNQTSLDDWLKQELYSFYRVPNKLAERWLKNDELILFLDGLDEVAEESRPECLREINEFLQKGQENFTAIAICCRISDYDALDESLELPHAVLIRPLTSKQIEDYLEEAGSQLAILRQELTISNELRSLAKTPLVLNIMALTYHDLKENQYVIPRKDRTERQYLFDRYVRRMFEHREVSEETYLPIQTIGWLQWLACQMLKHSQSRLYIEMLQPSWLKNNMRFRMYQLIGVLTIGTVLGVLSSLFIGYPSAGLLMGAFFGLAFAPPHYIEPIMTANFSWRNGIKFGLPAGLLASVLSLLIQSLIDWSFNTEVLNSSLLTAVTYILLCVAVFGKLELKNWGEFKFSWRSDMIPGLLLGLIISVILGGGFGLIYWINGEFYESLGSLLAFIIITPALTASIFAWVADEESIEIVHTEVPNHGIWVSLQQGLILGLGAFVLAGLGIGAYNLYFGDAQNDLWNNGVPDWLDLGLTFGLLMGLIIGLFAGLRECLSHLLLRCFLFHSIGKYKITRVDSHSQFALSGSGMELGTRRAGTKKLT